MLNFLIPLIVGFTFNSASTFTTIYAHWFGVRGGRLVSILLRDVLGIPVWVLGYVMATRTPSPQLFSPTLISSILAWLFLMVGATIILTGLFSLRWRAAAPSMQDTLVMQGIYAHIRHPLYSGLLLELAGLVLWVPSLVVLIASFIGWLWVMLQARLEEIDLVQRLPAYRGYMTQVPRFLPKVRLH